MSPEHTHSKNESASLTRLNETQADSNLPLGGSRPRENVTRGSNPALWQPGSGWVVPLLLCIVTLCLVPAVLENALSYVFNCSPSLLLRSARGLS